MGRPLAKFSGGRYRVILTFDMPTVPPTRADLREFIKEALETHQMGYIVEGHPLFDSLSQVTVEAIERIRRE